MEIYLKMKLEAWIDGWVDATGHYYTYICTDKRSKKKLIEFLNVIIDYSELRKKIFDDFFEVYGFVYDIETDNIISIIEN